jgi:hypothetical protein
VCSPVVLSKALWPGTRGPDVQRRAVNGRVGRFLWLPEKILSPPNFLGKAVDEFLPPFEGEK